MQRRARFPYPSDFHAIGKEQWHCQSNCTCRFVLFGSRVKAGEGAWGRALKLAGKGMVVLGVLSNSINVTLERRRLATRQEPTCQVGDPWNVSSWRRVSGGALAANGNPSLLYGMDKGEASEGDSW